jgi:creatinine amidohydrolase
VNAYADTQLELLRPLEIDEALTRRSLVYVPLGSIEFHAQHLPVGLDALTAHGVCLRAAAVGGGLVYPVLYVGTGGGHTSYPWTVMIEPDALEEILETLLNRLEEFGVQRAILFTGHFADEQLDVIDRVAQAWSVRERAMEVLALGVNRCPVTAIPPDHAGVFETSLLSAFWPDRVDIDALPSLAESPSIDPGGDPQGPHRHDPSHPLYGVFGPDPRGAVTRENAAALADSLVSWLVGVSIHQLA